MSSVQQAVKARRVDLTTGPVASKLIALAWPLFVGNILNTFYNLADMYWVSWVSTDAVAAVAITFPTVWLTFSFGLGVTIAGTAFVARHFGAGQPDQAAKVTGQVLLLATLVGALLGGVGAFLRVPILRMMGAQDAVLEMASVYLLIEFLGLPLRYAYFAYRSVSQGAGDSKTPRNLLIFSVGLNMVLDPFFILGLAGLPSMGVLGAAWATFISQGIGALLSLVILFRGRMAGVALRLHHFRPDLRLLGQVARVGLPASLDMGARGLSSVVVAAIVSRFGAVEAAAYGIVNRLMSVTWTSAGAMEQAVASGVGQSLGAKDPRRAARIGWTGAGIMFAFLTAVGLCLFVFPESVVGIFRVEEHVNATAVRFLRLHVLSYGFWGMRDVLQGAFRGAGHTLPPAVITWLNLWVAQIPLSLWTSYALGWGADGYWIVLCATNLVFAAVASIWFRFGSWQESKRPGQRP